MRPGVTPRIGLSIYRETARWGVWTQPADLLPARYADSVRAGGGLPLLLPPGTADVDVYAESAVDAVDGLVLTGGADVAPELYGAVRHKDTDHARTDRDAWEIALARAAVRADRPLLAICRGMQVLNVALGGTLIQHLPDVVGHHEHRGDVGNYTEHRIRLAPESGLVDAYGANPSVPTHHHQAIDRLAPAITATGWAEDGTIEAVVCPGQAWMRGVQWHPEVRGGAGLFRMFVAACADLMHADAVGGPAQL